MTGEEITQALFADGTLLNVGISWNYAIVVIIAPLMGSLE